MALDDVFRFYLKKDDSTYYTVSNGKVIETATKTQLKQAISGWNEATMAAKSSDVYWTPFREYTMPMKFVLDGATILRYVIANEGFTANCILYIEKLNPTIMSYQYWHDCTIDFSQYSNEDDYFSVNLLERGLVGLIKNRENVAYEVAVSGGVQLLLDGVKLGANASWVFGDSASGAPGQPASFTHGPTTGWIVTGSGTSSPSQAEIFVTTQLGNAVQAGNFIVPRDAISTPDGAPYAPAESFSPQVANTSMKATAKWFSVDFSGNMVMGAQAEATGNVSSGVKSFKILVYAGVSIGGVRDTTKTILLGESDTFDNDTFVYLYMALSGHLDEVEEGSDIFFYTVLSVGDTNTATFNSATFQRQYFIDGSTVHLIYKAQVSSTIDRCLRYIDFMSLLVEQMTDGAYSCKSDFLSNPDVSATFRNANFDNSPYNTMVTCGDSLRGLSDAKIKTSFKDAMADLWGRWMLSWGIEDNVVRIEPLAYFWANTELFSVPNISNLNTSLFKDKIFNQLKVGYNSYDNDTVDGKNEFNTGITFLAKANTIVAGTDDNTCPYRSDVYGIESIRSKTFDDDTVDNKFDNDTFVIEIDPTPEVHPGFEDIYFVYKPTPISISGVDDPVSMYNITLSPKRALYRHLDRLISLVDRGILQYQTIDKNPDLVSDLGAGLITETADVNLEAPAFSGHAFGRIFQPTVFQFDCTPPYNLAEILALKTKGYISFYWVNPRTGENVHFKGFILDIGCTPATRDKYTFKLLSHPDNDLSKLM